MTISEQAVLNYLSTMNFSDEFLERIRSTSPNLNVRQITASSVEEIPDEVWYGIDIVHTSMVLPDPRKCPRLKWVQLDTSGVDHCIGTELWNSKIPITTLGGISPRSLAEFVVWAVLSTAHQLPEILEVRRAHTWPTSEERWVRMMPTSIVGATVGIIGYGRIGREIGRLLALLGMNVIGMTSGRLSTVSDKGDLYRGTTMGAEGAEIVGPERLDSLVARSDYLVVVAPLTESTRGMVDDAALKNLRPGSVLINVARGGIVDEDALRLALADGRLRSAVLDVFDDEPLASENPWWDEDKVVITPHVSGLAPTYADQVVEIVGENVQRLLDGEPLMNRVDRSKGY